MGKKTKNAYTHTLFQRMTVLYGAILMILGLLTVFFAYRQEHESMKNRLELVMREINFLYESRTRDVWRFYLPIFENRDTVYKSLDSYFSAEDPDSLTPMQRRDLAAALRSVMTADPSIAWVGIYAGAVGTGYLLPYGAENLTAMPETFAFRDILDAPATSMEVYETRRVTVAGEESYCFALCGVAPTGRPGGKIIIGYTASDFAASYVWAENVENARFYVVDENGLIFDSEKKYAQVTPFQSAGISRNREGNLIYQNRLDTGVKRYRIYCEMSLGDMILASQGITPYIWVLLTFFFVFSLLLYRWTSSAILHKTAVIQKGLEHIGHNDLDYRIFLPGSKTDEFTQIARSVNDLAERLQENIDRESLARLKRKEAELSELQAKFDPHFLYNSLEVIRGKVYENGDEETADIIVKLAQIFRSFIGGERFVSVQEEIDFCNLYLSLLEYRYDEQVEIIYDIDSEVLRYGIIRNLLQPLLENYFVHGFHSGREDNKLIIRGKIEDGKYIRFRIQDNGMGVSIQRLRELKEKLDVEEEVARSSRGSYGIQNVHRRIRLFYGPECGLQIDSNEDGGVTAEVKILMLSCQEHEERFQITSTETFAGAV